MFELGKGIFDKTKMPRATSQYKDKHGNVIVDVGERYQNWGQFIHHTSKGIFIINKLRRLATVIEREHFHPTSSKSFDVLCSTRRYAPGM